MQWSKRLERSVVSPGRGWPKEEKKLKVSGRMKAPWWCMSSQNQSAMGAWGETAAPVEV